MATNPALTPLISLPAHLESTCTLSPQPHRVATAPAPLDRSRPRTRATDLRNPRALADNRRHERPEPSAGDLDGDLEDELAEELDLAEELHRVVTDDKLAQVLPDLFAKKGEANYLRRLQTKKWRAGSKAVAITEVLNFAHWLQRHAPGVPVQEVEVAHISSYLEHLLARLAPTTVRLSLVCLRVYYDFLTDSSRQRPAGNPAREVPLPARELPLIQPYSEQEAAWIFAAIAQAARTAQAEADTAGWLLAERDYAMLATIRFAGIRRGELRRLRVRDLDLPRATIRIRGKGARDRTITVPRALVATLRRYLSHVRRSESATAFVFCELDRDQLCWVHAGADADNDGRYLTPELVEQARQEDADYGLGKETLTRRARAYARAAGVGGLHAAHRWRHTHATALAQAGMSLNDIAARLGHDLSKRQDGAIGWNPITLYYVSLSQDYLADVVETALSDPLAG